MRYLILSLLFLGSLTANCQKYFLFIGTYTGSGSKGIYVYTFNAATGKARWISNTAEVVNPSYLAISPAGTEVYACNETNITNGGGISAFKFNRKTGSLTLINKQSSGGDDPAYVAMDKKGKWVMVANYSGGNFSAFRINASGGLQPFSQLIQHSGNSVDTQRQQNAHVHSTVFSPEEKYLFAADLGMDKVMIYNFNTDSKKPLTPAVPAFERTDPGSGPRHFIFHPNGKWAYLIEEMAGTVVAYNYKKGKLTFIEKIATHTDTAKGSFGSADIHISPDGKFLYASNRGNENNITIFSIDKFTGKLLLKGYQHTMGIKPRNFIIDPSGKYLLAANQQTNNIVIFKRNIKTGLLKYTGRQINIPKPVCLKMSR